MIYFCKRFGNFIWTINDRVNLALASTISLFIVNSPHNFRHILVCFQATQQFLGQSWQMKQWRLKIGNFRKKDTLPKLSWFWRSRLKRNLHWGGVKFVSKLLFWNVCFISSDKICLFLKGKSWRKIKLFQSLNLIKTCQP